MNKIISRFIYVSQNSVVIFFNFQYVILFLFDVKLCKLSDKMSITVFVEINNIIKTV